MPSKNFLAIAGIAALLLSAMPTNVFAGPPFVTDDPEPTEYQHIELYVAYEQTRTRAGVEGALPKVELNFGAAPNLQLSIALPLAFNRLRGAASHEGLGDISLSAKYRFVQESATCPMLASYPSVTVPSGNSNLGLGSGASQIYLPLWAQKSWGEWQSYGGGGYLIDHSQGAKNHWFFGWQVQKTLSEKLYLGAELFHTTESAQGDGSSTGFNLGGGYSFTGNHHVVFSAGRSISPNGERARQFSSYLAYELTF
jgi:hypothetical protein